MKNKIVKDKMQFH